MSDQAETNPLGGAEAVTRFWTEMATRMAAESFSAPPGTPQFAERMRDVFFEVMSRQADEFMRSEAFLSAMKQSMEASLAFRKQLNDMLSKTVQQFQMPTAGDVEDVAELIRRMEDRLETSIGQVAGRLDRLEQRLEQPRGHGADETAQRGRKSKPSDKPGGMPGNKGREGKP